MTTLEVEPSALVSAAAAVRCFSLDLDPVVLHGSLVDALTGEFSSRWGSALHALAADAEDTGVALREAADDYGDLERLLMPR